MEIERIGPDEDEFDRIAFERGAPSARIISISAIVAKAPCSLIIHRTPFLDDMQVLTMHVLISDEGQKKDLDKIWPPVPVVPL